MKDGKWVTEEEIVDMAVSELGRKVWRLALGTEKRKGGEESREIKVKSRKVIKLEKGQTTLSFGIAKKPEAQIEAHD